MFYEKSLTLNKYNLIENEEIWTKYYMYVHALGGVCLLFIRGNNSFLEACGT